MLSALAAEWQAPEFASLLRGKCELIQRARVRDVYLWYAPRGTKSPKPCHP